MWKLQLQYTSDSQQDTYRTHDRRRKTTCTVWNVGWFSFNYRRPSALCERFAGTDTLGVWRFSRRQRLGVKHPTDARPHSGAPGWPNMDLTFTVLSATLQDKNANCTGQNPFSEKWLSLRSPNNFLVCYRRRSFFCRIRKISLLVTLVYGTSSVHKFLSLFFLGNFTKSWKAILSFDVFVRLSALKITNKLTYW
jgi:hypothetical protein